MKIKEEKCIECLERVLNKTKNSNQKVFQFSYDELHNQIKYMTNGLVCYDFRDLCGSIVFYKIILEIKRKLLKLILSDNESDDML